MFAQEAMDGSEAPIAEDNIFLRIGLDVTEPVGLAQSRSCHGLGNFLVIVHDLKHRLMAQPGVPADMGQEQEAISKKTAEMPAIDINRSVEKTAE